MGSHLNRLKGRRSEAIAISYLRQLGWKITASNVYLGHAEIDLIAHDGKQLVFVEVKSNWDLRYGHPAGKVCRRKQILLWEAAWRWLLIHKRENDSMRFDVITLRWERGKATINHIVNAFAGPRAHL